MTRKDTHEIYVAVPNKAPANEYIQDIIECFYFLRGLKIIAHSTIDTNTKTKLNVSVSWSDETLSYDMPTLVTPILVISSLIRTLNKLQGPQFMLKVLTTKANNGKYTFACITVKEDTSNVANGRCTTPSNVPTPS